MPWVHGMRRWGLPPGRHQHPFAVVFWGRSKDQQNTLIAHGTKNGGRPQLLRPRPLRLIGRSCEQPLRGENDSASRLLRGASPAGCARQKAREPVVVTVLLKREL